MNEKKLIDWETLSKVINLKFCYDCTNPECTRETCPIWRELDDQK